MSDLPLDEVLARAALARGLITPAQVELGRSRQPALRAASQPSDLLAAMGPSLTPAVQQELRRMVFQATASRGASSSAVNSLASSHDPSAPVHGPSSADLGLPIPRTRAPGVGGEAALPSPGERIAGYLIERELARGGMGAVYVASQEGLERKVALKVRLPSGDARAAARFVIEAQSAARLKHPAIVRVHVAGQDAAGREYLVMDFVEGEALDRRVIKQGPLPPLEAAAIARTIGRALEHAHQNGILHRDLKPANIIVRADDGQPLLTDFGLAKVVDGGQALTRTGEVMGTPSFMAPEQAAGELGRIDRRTDVYGLGATLYHLLCGRPPFEGAGVVAVITAVLKNQVVPPRKLRPEIPPEVEAVVLRALAGRPELRYPTAGAMADDLDRALGGGETVARREARTEGRRDAARRLGVAAALAVVVAGVLGGVWAATRPGTTGVTPVSSRTHPEPTTTPTTTEPSATTRPPPPVDAGSGSDFGMEGEGFQVDDAPAAEAGSAFPESQFVTGEVWLPLRGATKQPAGRWSHALAWDGARKVTVLLGGHRGGLPFADEWTWDGERWREVAQPAAAPPARFGHAMVWDAARRRLVLFGGYGGRGAGLGLHDDLWEHDGSRWSRVEPQGERPVPRVAHAMVWDPAGKRVLLFGGRGGDRLPRADLWGWDGARWTELAPPPAVLPTPRAHCAAAWDAARGVLVVLGADTPAADSDTWEWSPAAGWTRGAALPAGGRNHPVLVATGGDLLLFGGFGRMGAARNDTYRLSGGAWALVPPALGVEWLPPARGWHAGAWDAERGEVVIFGGSMRTGGGRLVRTIALGDTWKLRPKG